MNEKLYIARCLELAKSGFPDACPNPLVGCVIVHDNKIIGEGYHQRFGDSHAEANAIRSVSQTDLLKDSTLYVNLEPCSHHGKTPPCADLIIRSGIRNVIISEKDPFGKVSGRGIKKLKEAGINVDVGVLRSETKSLNKRFFTYVEKRRPYVILKWAETQDGYIADSGNNSKWISNEYSRMIVHKWRSEEPAILVGRNTVFYDDPTLNVRDWEGRDPLRVVIDKKLELSSSLNVFNSCSKTLIFNEISNKIQGDNEYVKVRFDKSLMNHVLNHLYNKDIQSLIVEGGSATLQSFIESNLWDEARIFISQKRFEKGIKSPVISMTNSKSKKIGNDNLVIIKNEVY